ncbi:efflux transporter outer membrane subunit [Massilibacteroides vaginae]|uniref:efflux transporter outer membrane subunit n=1 Tax=Massilibacteroides vaginae TaxID=1673718 RepID=UPI0029372522|nr:efflux transporter outer membrane subunit [Massilibacteroides vaginae]
MMKYKYIKGVVLLSVFLSIGLSSCQVLNKYKSPEIDLEHLYRDNNSTDTTTIANYPWRAFFNDQLLIALIDEGLKHNFDLQIAHSRIKQAEASLGMARAAYFPDLALVGQVSHNRFSNGVNGKDVLGYDATDYRLGVAVSWEADIWGKINRQHRAKYAQFLSSHAYKNLVQTSLIANIATSYYTLLALDEQLKVTNETIELLKESVETIEALKEAGMQNGAAIEQSKAFLYSTQVTVPNLESQIRELENTICFLIGRKSGVVLRSPIQQQEVISGLQYGLPVQMLAKRPDVQQAELSFRSAFELTNAAQASFYPSITLNSSMIGYNAATLSNFFKPENIFASIVGGLAQPLFARKQLIANYQIAKAQQKEALLTFEKTVLSAGKEVSDILFSLESSLKKNEIRAKQVEASQNSVDYTKELLKAAEANYIEVLNAEQSLLSAQLSQVNDKLEQLQYSVNLYRALGGGGE